MRVRKGFVLREVAGEHVLVPTGQLVKSVRKVFILSESAASIWEKLQDEFTAEELEKEMMKSYPDADPGVVHDDMEKYIAFLRGSDIVEL